MTLLDKTIATSVYELSREELLMLKNVLYESYVEIGEWEFHKLTGRPPEDALKLLKAIHTLLKSTI